MDVVATLGNAVAELPTTDLQVISQQLTLIYNALRLLIFLDVFRLCKGMFGPLLGLMKK